MRQGLALLLGCCGIVIAYMFFATRDASPISAPPREAEHHRESPAVAQHPEFSTLPSADASPMRSEVGEARPQGTSEQLHGNDGATEEQPGPPTSTDPITYLRQTIRGLPQYRTETPKFEINSRMVARDDRLNPQGKALSAEDARLLDQDLAAWNAMIADVSDKEWKKRGEAYLTALDRGDLVRSDDGMKIDPSTVQGKRDFVLQSSRQEQLRGLKAIYHGDFVYMVIAGPPTLEDQTARYIVYLHRASAPEVFDLKDAGDKLRMQRADAVRAFLAGLK